VSNLASSLTTEDVNILLGRKQGLEEFEVQIRSDAWTETEWQDFFERESWVFGLWSRLPRDASVRT